MNSVYKRILDDSPMAYFYIRGIKNEEGKYIDVQVIDANDALSQLFNIDLSKLINYKLREDMKEIEKTLKLINILERALENKKYTVKKYIDEYKLNFNIDTYSVENDEFVVKFIEIAQESKLISSILRKSPFCTWIKDRSGRYIDVNNKFLELFDLDYSDVTGKTDFDIFNENVAKIYRDNDNEVIINNNFITHEVILNRYKGREIYLKESKWPYKDKDNNIIGTIGAAVDITESSELRRNIEQNEQNFMDIASNIEEVFIIRDEHKATYISPSFEKIFGESPDKLYEDINTWVEYYNPEDIKK